MGLEIAHVLHQIADRHTPFFILRVPAMLAKKKLLDMPSAADALPGRASEMPVAARHTVLGTPLKGPWPAHLEVATFGLGCFWGAERLFWKQKGVHSTSVGYAAGLTPNPTYEEVCTGRTGHNEVVQVVFDPKVVSFAELVKLFFENHDPTQGMRQGGDIGTQYRSGIYVHSAAQRATAETARAEYAARLKAEGFGAVTTEILDVPAFYYAEDYHQQYLDKNPDGYCGLGGTGVTCPIGVGVAAR
ncbi:MAG TPA: peptide-methionine (S)-S-oxide reductase MsrA [Micropepsaceae bacterium]|nr:peptide-methionine (S)-S-oxide reductase MsrA [Micropepsaceae bacterium]